MMRASVIGAGLAGCEAAWQLSRQGIEVDLYEMKPHRFSPAHRENTLAELVCSNSLRSNQLTNAVGLLKEEMRRFGSLILSCADETSVDAGGALAVDRKGFSELVTKRIEENKLINLIRQEVKEIPEGDVIIATGPLSSEAISGEISKLIGREYLSFFDASAPIVTLESVDMGKAFYASRYGKGSGTDYLNCPMNKEEYDAFVEALLSAETVQLHEFERGNVFEGCMPVEVMASRGRETLAHGPMKPVGLPDPVTGKLYYAVVQLRRDNAEGTLYNLVGFQTNLKFPEQKRVFSMIPALKKAVFARYGVMHRNTFIDSPSILGTSYELLADPRISFAGQMTGVEGYVESASSGMLAGINKGRVIKGFEKIDFTRKTAIGALAYYVSSGSVGDFQPMNITYGLIDPMDVRIKKKGDRYMALANRSLEIISEIGGRL